MNGGTVEFTLDGRPLRVAEGTTILEAAESAGVAIPHFCRHPAFPPEGTCRLCVVEIAGSPKLELSCSTAARPGMAVLTTSPRVVEARRDVLEMFLAEHPLDCPVCDKAGECLLQDYHGDHGRHLARSRERREAREKKLRIGKSLLLDRERCVLCTRCVRFLRQVTGTGELGIFERGLGSEVGIVEGRPVDNPYSGNLVDLCPVGAITDLTFRYRGRVWFLRPEPTVCHLCSRGCSIWADMLPPPPRADHGRPRALRARPRPNPLVNGHWICDAGRYGWPFFDQNRLERAFIRRGGLPAEASVDEALTLVARKVRRAAAGEAGGLTVLLHSNLTNEELAAAKRLFVDGLRARVMLVEPPREKPDGRLFTGERAANPRGAREAGFAPAPPDWAGIRKGAGVMLVFGASSLLGRFRFEDLREGLSAVPFAALAAAHGTGLETAVEAVLPSALPPEKEGTVTNVDGVVQALRPVAPPPGASLPEGEILRRLAREMEPS